MKMVLNTTKIIFFLFIFFSNIQITYAQESVEIIFFNGDTIKEQLNARKLKYSKDSIFLNTKSLSGFFSPNEIKQLKTNNLNLQSASVLIRNKEVGTEFIEPIITGYISLYQSYRKNGRKLFYLQKGDSAIYQIPKKYYKGYVNLMFSDCNSLNIEMNDTSMNRFDNKLSDWHELVSAYNECKGFANNTIVYKEPIIKSRNFIAAGISTSAFYINTLPYSLHNFSPKFSPYAGINFGFEYFERIGIFIAGNLRYYGSESGFVAKGNRIEIITPLANNIHKVNVDVNLKYSLLALEIPLFVKIKLFTLKKKSPYFEFGSLMSSVLINKSRALAIDDYIYPGIYDDKIRFDRFNLGKYIGGGIDFPLNNRSFSANFTYINMKYASQPIYSYGFSDFNATTFIYNYCLGIRMVF